MLFDRQSSGYTDCGRMASRLAGEFHILRVVIEPDHGLHFARANAEPIREFVVAIRPIELNVIIAELTDVARVCLRAHAEIRRNRRRDVDAAIGHGPAKPPLVFMVRKLFWFEMANPCCAKL